MSLQIKNKYLLLIALLAFLTIFGSGWYIGMSKQRSLKIALEKRHKTDIYYYKTIIGDDSLYIAEATQTIATQRELIRQGEIERDLLRKLNVKHLNELTKLKLIIDTLLVNVSHNGQVISVPCDTTFNNTGNNHLTNTKVILLPFEFNKADKWLSLKGTFDKDGELSIAQKLNADVSVLTGINKQKKPFAIVTTDCPYLQTLNVVSYKTDMSKPKHYSVGLQAGYGINKNFELSPYIGVGISLNLFSF